MFEQESYNFEVPVEPLHEGDLFYNYEVGTWKITSGILVIFALSAVLSLAFIGTVGQTNVLMARGCDSPFVGRVCQVLDMAYVSTVLFGTDREYVDAAYERTDLGEVEVTWIDQTGVPAQFEYPEGYFYKEPSAQDPLAMNSTDGFLAPGIPSVSPVQSGNSLIDTPAVAPKKNRNAVVGEVPDSPFDLSDTDTATDKTPDKKGKGSKNSNTSNSNQTVAQNNSNTNTDPNAVNEDEAKADKFGIYINKRPMKDKAKETLKDVEEKKVQLDLPFKVTITGTLGLGKDGKTVILKNPKPVAGNPPVKNDPAMEKLVQDWILAVGDAGWLGYLDKLKAKQLVITIEQNDTDLIASVKADQPTENVASSAASGLSTLLQIAATQVKDDEKTFLEKATVKSEGKTFVLNFSIPKPVVQEMIQRKLAETAIENKNTVNSLVKSANSTAAK